MAQGELSDADVGLASAPSGSPGAIPVAPAGTASGSIPVEVNITRGADSPAAEVAADAAAADTQTPLSDADVGLSPTRPLTNSPTNQVSPDPALSFLHGVLTPIDHASAWLEGGLENLGIPVKEAEHAIGAKTAEEANAAQKAWFDQQAESGHTTGGLGEFAGNVVGTLPLSALPGGALAQGAVGGALLSQGTNTGDIVKDAAIGAAGGKLADVGLNAAASFLAPKLSPLVQTLADAGVRMTPGQLAGGAIKRGEDLFSHVPILSGLVNDARATSYADFNKAAVNRALEPIGERLPDNVAAGHDAVKYATQKLSDAYNTTLRPLTAVPDGQLSSDIAQIAADAQSRLPADITAHFNHLMSNRVVGQLSGSSPITGQRIQDVLEDLGSLASSGKSQGGYSGDMGDALTKIQGAIKDWVARQNPQAADALGKASEGWANLVRVRSAASKTADGVFSPAQLSTSVRMSDGSAGKGAVARGEALMQDLSSAGQKVLPNKAPNSGTPIGHAVQLGLAAVLGGHAAEHVSPEALAAAAAMAAPYLKPSINALNVVATTPRPAAAKAAAQAVRQAAPYLRAIGPAGLLRISNQQPTP
jgi:hypothetical protein